MALGVLLGAVVAGCGADASGAPSACTDESCVPTTKGGAASVGNDEVSSATDGARNGTETDVDCGGQSGVRCAVGKECLVDDDCSGACDHSRHCIEIPSCKPHFGGDTCGTGEVGEAGAAHESCCRTLAVEGFEDAHHAGKKVFLDKYEITAGRVRAFVDAIAEKQGGKPDVKAWLTANRPSWWNDAWTPFLPSGEDGAMVDLPHASGGRGVTSPANAGTSHAFGSAAYVYVHGANCGHSEGAYGFSTYWYPPDVMDKNEGLPRAFSQEELDVKSMTCIPNAVLAAFCHWDGGQLATDDVLDFVTGSEAVTSSPWGGAAGSQCGCSGYGCQSRCPKLDAVNATYDAGSGPSKNYYYPEVESPEGSEGVQRIAAPGRVAADRVAMSEGAEAWADLVGNLHEMTLDSASGPSGGAFKLKYGGIGYSSSRAQGNTDRWGYPEYKAGYSGGRCMRFR